MKVGIITLSGYWNYGNRLQNLALKVALERQDYVEVTSFKTWQTDELKMYNAPLKFLRQLKNGNLKSYLKLLPRQRNFKKFSRQYLAESTFTVDVLDKNNKLEKFDKIIVGSDQVWNATWLTEQQLEFFLLHSVSPEKRIAYAASFGIQDFAGFEAVFKRELEKFSAISVREESGQKMVESLIGQKPYLVLDPTLLLSRSDWENLIGKRNNVSEPYIVEYFLGDMNSEATERLSKIESEYNEVVKLHDEQDMSHYSDGPLQFVRWISDADVVVTDSFHATVFALLFGKSVLITERSDGKSMSSRLTTLFNHAGVQPILLDAYTSKNDIPDYSELDLDTKLAGLRSLSVDYLTSSLNATKETI